MERKLNKRETREERKRPGPERSDGGDEYPQIQKQSSERNTTIPPQNMAIDRTVVNFLLRVATHSSDRTVL